MTDHQQFLLTQHESAVGAKPVTQLSPAGRVPQWVLHALLRRELKGHLHQKLRDGKVNNLGVQLGKVTEKLEVLQVPVTPEVR